MVDLFAVLFSWFMILLGAAAFLVGLCFSGDIAFCAFGISCLVVVWWLVAQILGEVLVLGGFVLVLAY